MERNGLENVGANGGCDYRREDGGGGVFVGREGGRERGKEGEAQYKI